MVFFPLYIDPGTGSALFSIAIGIATVGYFLFRAFIIKLKVFLFRGTEAEQSQNNYVIYSEDRRYWPFFQLILDEFESRETEVLYLASSGDDPVFSAEYKYIKSKFIGKGNKAYAFLNFLSAGFVLATTTDLDVLQWKRSKKVKHYCHMFHGVGGSMLYRLFSLDYYDSVLLSGENEIPEIRYLEKLRKLPNKQLVVAGNTYFDKYVEELKNIPKEEAHPFTVLVSPTWGPSGLLKVYGEKLLDPLADTDWRIIVRPHPQSSIAEKAMLERLVERYKNNTNIEWDYNDDNINTLSKSDVMISDYSCIVFDYIFLFDRPVLLGLQTLDFRPFDAYNLEHEPSFYQIIKKVGMEFNESNLGSIKETISGLVQDTALQQNREEAKMLMWQHQGESAKRIADFMIETVNKEAN
ncbi:MAG: CDP-glycerol glycerophosphotransferase family protein [Treponema sp.]|nr:CDP-glycerol glycerophosphotransferase family protein [Treponema sp.]